MVSDPSYFESASTVASQPLPTPADTPYETPYFPASRKSSGHRTPRSFTPPTPPQLPLHDFAGFNDATMNDNQEKRSSRDLTPKLYAALVSQIHDLRRELESRDSYIDQIESSLSDERSNNEGLQDELRRKDRDAKKVQTQIQSIEDSTMAIMDDLVKERDAAQTSATDLRKKVDAYTKQSKSEREHIDQVHAEWEKERVKWNHEKGILLRKNEVAESRLEVVLQEVTSIQMNSNERAWTDDANKENVAPLRDGISSMHSSPTKPRRHRRNQSSLTSISSFRQSTNLNGVTLADELKFDSASEAASDGETSDEEARLKKARDSRRSGVQDAKARKVLGIVSGIPEQHAAYTTPAEAVRKPEGEPVQPTQPNIGGAVMAAAHRLAQSIGVEKQQTEQLPEAEGVEANQRRKRDPLIRNAQSQHSRAWSEPIRKQKASQTTNVDDLASSPGSPSSIKSFVSAVGVTMQEPVPRPEMISSATQTEQPEEPRLASLPQPTRAPPPLPIEVPSIAIHPPDSSGPSSPGEAVLPPRTKSIGIQTHERLPVLTADASVQTDKIRVDQRPIKLPSHLLPAALKADDQPGVHTSTGRAQGLDGIVNKDFAPASSPTDSVFRDTSSASRGSQVGDSYEAQESSWSRLRKTLMLNNRHPRPYESDPFSGHEDGALSESEFSNPLPTMRGKRSQKYTRPSFDPPTPVPEDEKVVSNRPQMSRAPPSGGSRGSFERQNMSSKTHSYTIAAKGKQPQRPSNNIPQRPGSPSSVASSSAWSRNSGPQPPIAIPLRTSSAGMRRSRSSGRSSQTWRSGASSPTKRGEGMRVGKKPVLRKMKSATITPSDAPNGSLPLSPLSRASFASVDMTPSTVPNSASLPPQQTPGHQRSSSSQTRRLSSFLPTGEASVGTNAQHTVAHALKETMIGEWMWKYTRKRKSFGISDSTGENGYVRHKRWMWLSPDERTVMWSSKQPRSESAWLGKSGRKLPISQVLDIKDDNSAQAQRYAFNQSILIVTPSRTLKFTAITRERHYLWLTALSFLSAHTSNQSLDLSYLTRPGQVPIDQDQEASRASSATLSRSSKKPWSSKNRSRQSSGYATPSIPEASASAEGNGLTMQAKPTRPVPATPLEHYLPDTALAPSIPRVPGNGSSSRINLHGRKRSASTTGIVSSRASTKANNSGTSSLRNFPTNFTNSSSRSAGTGANAANARPPMPSLPASRAGQATSGRLIGPARPPTSGSGRLPATPVDEGDPENRFAECTIGVDEVLEGVEGKPGQIRTEFGTNHSFFDAAGRPRYPPRHDSRRPGHVFDDHLHSQEQMAGAGTKTNADFVAHPVQEDEDELLGQGHAINTSVDSVAPPPIPRRMMHSIDSDQDEAKPSTSRRRKWF